VETVVAGGSTDRPRLAVLPPKPVAAAIGTPTQSEKVARIFGAMPAKDAAKVLEQLDDAEVQSIMSGLSAKQAAAIMQHLPTARAASISKLVLRGSHE
jgi:flagellar motility protein MotE (MotC chaperone)